MENSIPIKRKEEETEERGVGERKRIWREAGDDSPKAGPSERRGGAAEEEERGARGEGAEEGLTTRSGCGSVESCSTTWEEEWRWRARQ